MMARSFNRRSVNNSPHNNNKKTKKKKKNLRTEEHLVVFFFSSIRSTKRIAYVIIMPKTMFRNYLDVFFLCFISFARSLAVLLLLLLLWTQRCCGNLLLLLRLFFVIYFFFTLLFSHVNTDTRAKCTSEAVYKAAAKSMKNEWTKKVKKHNNDVKAESITRTIR